MWLLPDQLRSEFAAASGCSKKPSDWCSPEAVARPCVNGKPTPRPRSWRGWKMRPWSARLFGAAISETSTQRPFADWWTSSLRACRASLTASPDGSKATPTPEAGENTETVLSPDSCESWKPVAPPWCSSKTSQLGFALDGFDSSARNYADWVTRSLNLSFSLRKMLAQATSGNGCSSWPTPRTEQAGFADDGKGGRSLDVDARTWPSPRSEDSESCGNHPGATDSLTGAIAHWPTPRAFDFKGGGENTPENGYLDRTAENWQTPSQQGHTSRCQVGDTERQDLLPKQAEKFSPPAPAPATGDKSSINPRTLRRRLNPAFACWLMGWPWWWTRPEPINFAASAMASWRCALRSRLWKLCGE